MQENPFDATDDADHFIQKWKDDLPPGIVPVIQEHHRNLIDLSRSLTAAGRDPEEIRRCVHVLIASYEKKLIEAIDAETDP
ncbi:MAG: hypothetical protein JJU09_02340 [Rhodobacteraceae bacterium]|nr:hypothetical protein [Paracoccaceae bacterium]